MAAPEKPLPGAEPRGPACRLFFALWPQEAMRQAMVQATREAARASGGRPVPAASLHVTLAFLGSVGQPRLPALTEVARAAAGAPRTACTSTPSGEEPLEIVFDHLEHWRAAQLLCAAPVEPSVRTAALAGRLRALLVEHGFAPDLKPFRPHVTVVRKVTHPGSAGRIDPVIWRFTELALIESRTLAAGVLYSVVESHSLCSAPKGAK